MTKQKIEMRAPSDLIHYENNPRKNDHAVAKVAAAIREFGFRVPVLIRKNGEIIDGHLRCKAAIAAGLAEVPCLLADDMSEPQIKAFRLSVNKVAELAEWDEELLRAELDALRDEDYDLDLIGFEELEIDELLGNDESGDSGQDNVPPLPVDPVSCVGDIWLLGNHRVMCGDACSVENMLALMGGGTAGMVFTDPPYNVDYQGSAGKIKNDKMKSADFELFLSRAFVAICSVMRDGAAIYVAHADGGEIGINFRRAFLAAGFKLASCIIWRKNHFVLGRSDYQFMHEPILYGWKTGGGAHKWYGGRKKRSIQQIKDDSLCQVVSDSELHVPVGDDVLVVTGKDIEVALELGSMISEEKPRKSAEHPTMKPVALVERFIKNSSKRGDVVLDGFGGSGTTLISCEKTGRFSRIMEMDEKFIDVIVVRWQDFTGREAVLGASGKTFAEVKIERRR